MQLSLNTCAWLQIIRPPNLVTVPGDPLAGLILALYFGSDGSIVKGIVVVFSALLFYICGLIMNDYADVEEDSRERPERPIPSGVISSFTAVVSSFFLAVTGVGLSFLINVQTGWLAVLLLMSITLYNFVLKRYKIIGSIVMGVCRGVSLLLGASSVGYPLSFTYDPVLMIAVGIVLYIAALTSIAADETEQKSIGVKRWFPTVVITMLLMYVTFFLGRVHLLPFIPGILAVIMSVSISKQLGGVPEVQVVQKSIGGYIRILLLIQASICFILLSGIGVGIGLLLLWPAGKLLAKKFYAS